MTKYFLTNTSGNRISPVFEYPVQCIKYADKKAILSYFIVRIVDKVKKNGISN